MTSQLIPDAGASPVEPCVQAVHRRGGRMHRPLGRCCPCPKVDPPHAEYEGGVALKPVHFSTVKYL